MYGHVSEGMKKDAAQKVSTLLRQCIKDEKIPDKDC